jgi:8-oxo-dGTP pyrophosphatase MutT (NUDIX family)
VLTALRLNIQTARRMEMANESSAANDLPALPQVGALPVRFQNGRTEIVLLTSRETKRWVIPKGWPMKGIKDWAAADREAKEEAGIIGRPHKKPVGSFLYFKRRKAHFDLCRVEVYVLDYEKRLANYREKGQREARWFSVDEASDRVVEPGLIALLRDLDIGTLRKSTRKKAENKKPRKKLGAV